MQYKIFGGLVDRLCLAQTSEGSWEEFCTRRAGSAVEWVTAYIVATGFTSADLRGIACDQRINQAIGRGVQYLARTQRGCGGWGYNAGVPVDCDSTSFAVLALTGRGGAVFDSSAATRLILRHQHSDSGGFCTYINEGELRSYYAATGSTPNVSFAGWCMSHVEITAVAFEALTIAGVSPGEGSVVKARDFILQRRETSGLWRAYWSVGPFYATYRALRALDAVGVDTKSFSKVAASSIVRLQRENGSWGVSEHGHGCSFCTALAIGILARYVSDEGRCAMTKGLAWLAGRLGHHDLPSELYMRIPPPPVGEPDKYTGWSTDGSGKGAFFRDDRGLFTVATLLGVLGGLNESDGLLQ